MKKNYITPEIEFELLFTSDIITGSADYINDAQTDVDDPLADGSSLFDL